MLPGTAAVSPAPPTIPDGAVELYRVRYNAGSTAPIITDVRKYAYSGDVIYSDTPPVGVPDGTLWAPGVAQDPLREHLFRKEGGYWYSCTTPLRQASAVTTCGPFGEFSINHWAPFSSLTWGFTVVANPGDSGIVCVIIPNSVSPGDGGAWNGNAMALNANWLSNQAARINYICIANVPTIPAT